MKNISAVLPCGIASAISCADAKTTEAITDIRLRINKPVTVISNGRILYLGTNGYCTQPGICFCENDAEAVYRRLCEHSPYKLNQSIQNGYITINGGHRIGISGNTVTINGVTTFSEIYSFCIRRARQVNGCFASVAKSIDIAMAKSVLIYSLPGCGKTTMLRDACRIISNCGCQVALVDERNEISSTYKGIPRLDIGNNTDVIVNCSKTYGIINATRTLAPEYIFTDEVGTKEDIDAIINATKSGISVYATAHAENIEMLFDKGLNMFDVYVKLSKKCGVGTVESIDFNKKYSVNKYQCCI